jgi:hypothetical protein
VLQCCPSLRRAGLEKETVRAGGSRLVGGKSAASIGEVEKNGTLEKSVRRCAVGGLEPRIERDYLLLERTAGVLCTVEADGTTARGRPASAIHSEARKLCCANSAAHAKARGFRSPNSASYAQACTAGGSDSAAHAEAHASGRLGKINRVHNRGP